MKKIIVCVILFLLIVPGMAWGQYSNAPRGSGGSGSTLPADAPGYLKNDGSGGYSWDTPAGSGDVTKVGTPTEHQVGVWTGDGTIKGVTVTASKVVCTDANGSPTACTNLTDSRIATDLSITDQAAGDIIYFNGTNWIRKAKGANGSVWGVDADGNLGYYTSLSPKFVEVDGHTDETVLTAANLSRTFINSFGRTGAATLTLPAAAAGYSAVFIVGTQHNSLWKVQRAGTDTIYWDSGGTLTAGKTYFGETNQAVGSRVSCSTFRTGASAYSWLCGVVSGTWSTD